MIIGALYGHALNESALRDDAEKLAFENARRRDAADCTSSAKQTDGAANHTLDWHIQRFDDPMDDSVRYVFSLPGVKVENGIASYRPRLALQFAPKSMSLSTGAIDYTVDVAVIVGLEGVYPGSSDIEYRIGAKAAEKAKCIVSTDGNAAYLPASVFARLEGLNTLVVRVRTVIGGVRTLQFNLSGFRVCDVEAELRRRLEKERPIGVRFLK